MAAPDFHARPLLPGETQQSLVAPGLAADPLAPDPGTVAYVLHRQGEATASLVVYDAAPRRYRLVCRLVGTFSSASDLDAFDPLLARLADALRTRGFPVRPLAYRATDTAVDPAQYAPDAHRVHAAAVPRPDADAPAPARTVIADWYALAAACAVATIGFGMLALILNLTFRHREQMALVRRAAPAQRPPSAKERQP